MVNIYIFIIIIEHTVSKFAKGEGGNKFISYDCDTEEDYDDSSEDDNLDRKYFSTLLQHNPPIKHEIDIKEAKPPLAPLPNTENLKHSTHEITDENATAPLPLSCCNCEI
jgi:hypothetical protein